MTIVYATGRPRFFEFATTTDRNLLPEGASVLAVCEGGRATEFIDEVTFERMSDEEYYELRGVIGDAKSLELSRAELSHKVGSLGKFWDSLPRCRACEGLHV
jgi:hypothetical protein